MVYVMFERNRTRAFIVRYVIDETMIQIGATDAWLWIAVEPIHYRILGVHLSKHRNMLYQLTLIR
jgi:transposase-like protein